MVKRKFALPAVIILAAAFIAFIVASGDTDMGLLGKLVGRNTITTGLAEYVEEVTGINALSLCIGEEGEVQISSSEEYAYIRLKLQEGGAASVADQLSESGREPVAGNVTVPGYNGHSIAGMLRNENIEAVYTFMADGKGRTKTRSVEVYLTSDSEGAEYLYMFG